jgi:hypothetical protein
MTETEIAEMVQAINSLIKERNRSGQMSAHELQKELNTIFFERAVNYTNLILAAGYASAFGLWQFTKEYLGRDVTLMVALSLTLSICLFISFEVYKMISTTHLSRKLQLILETIVSPQDMTEATKLAWIDYSAKQSKLWAVALWPTIVFAAFAGILLIGSFVIKLLCP